MGIKKTVKSCKKHGNLSLEDIYFRKNRNSFDCKQCTNERNINNYYNNKEKYNKLNNERYHKTKHLNVEKRKLYRKEKKEFLSVAVNKWRKENASRHNSNQRKSKKNRIRDLSDGYVRELLTNNNGLSANLIPQELVEAKKIELKLKRKLKELKWE